VGAEPDVIAQGSDRAPWRPSGRLIGLLVVGALVATGVLVGRHTADQRAVDRDVEARAAAAVAFDVEQDAALVWRLRNTSSTTVRVTSAILDFPDLGLLEGATELEASDSTPLTVPDAACDTGLYERGPRSLYVEAVTANGTHVSQWVSLGSGPEQGIWQQLRETCRFFSPGDALDSRLLSSRQSGQVLRLVFQVGNRGGIPLVLEGVRYEPGVRVRATPTRLPFLASLDGTVTVTDLVVELRITDCGALVEALRRAYGGDGLDGPGSLKPQLEHDHARGSG
jgi:hypothetical protein